MWCSVFVRDSFMYRLDGVFMDPSNDTFEKAFCSWFVTHVHHNRVCDSVSSCVFTPGQLVIIHCSVLCPETCQFKYN